MREALGDFCRVIRTLRDAVRRAWRAYSGTALALIAVAGLSWAPMSCVYNMRADYLEDHATQAQLRREMEEADKRPAQAALAEAVARSSQPAPTPTPAPIQVVTVQALRLGRWTLVECTNGELTLMVDGKQRFWFQPEGVLICRDLGFYKEVTK